MHRECIGLQPRCIGVQGLRDDERAHGKELRGTEALERLAPPVLVRARRRGRVRGRARARVGFRVGDYRVFLCMIIARAATCLGRFRVRG